MSLREHISAVEHTMSKAIYLNDPDGNGLEITLETLERMRSLTVNDTGVELIDSECRQRNPSEQLEQKQVLGTLSDTDYLRPVPAAPKLGVANFYAGAPSPHLIAVNVWQ